MWCFAAGSTGKNKFTNDRPRYCQAQGNYDSLGSPYLLVEWAGDGLVEHLIFSKSLAMNRAKPEADIITAL